MQIHFYVALFWYQLFLDNEDFFYFMLTEQRLNGVSKARLRAHLQPHFNKKKKRKHHKTLQSTHRVKCSELSYFSPGFTSRVCLLMTVLMKVCRNEFMLTILDFIETQSRPCSPEQPWLKSGVFSQKVIFLRKFF